ncbi:MAG: ABC transporter ATP-binding protein [Deltaproteobacteria bacterium HGW-Deltaproteobacteria-19]|jgi:tungstate transport system ATP-binding protein|nr:MAG: ABC transporter ATP-binding protein [Deltaproteobacteria bacterium HGW-Deltaproteobacteria-19]
MINAVSILEIRDLEVRRGGVRVLDIPGFEVLDGEFLSLIGPNGAGKSTLLLVLACLLPRYRGSLSFRGASVMEGNGLMGYRRKISMVFQEPLLFDGTVESNVASGLRLHGVNRSNIGRIVGECMERFGIGNLKGRHARKLSGGEAQRTSLARAFAVGPEVIFLDEPFSSLDPPTREGLMEDLQRILRETKTTAVMATHDRVEALRLSSRMAIMKDGRIVQIGDPGDVMNRPQDEFVASFVGVETVLSGKIVGSGAGTVTVQVPGGKIESVGVGQVGDPVLCCIRPELVTLSTGSPTESASARNVLPGRIVKVIPMGLFYKVNIDCGFPLTAYVTASSVENLTLAEGSAVCSSFKATAVHLIRK